MSSERQGEHPARAYGVTGGGFAEGQADPEEFEEDQEVGSFRPARKTSRSSRRTRSSAPLRRARRASRT